MVGFTPLYIVSSTFVGAMRKPETLPPCSPITISPICISSMFLYVPSAINTLCPLAMQNAHSSGHPRLVNIVVQGLFTPYKSVRKELYFPDHLRTGGRTQSSVREIGTVMCFS